MILQANPSRKLSLVGRLGVWALVAILLPLAPGWARNPDHQDGGEKGEPAPAAGQRKADTEDESSDLEALKLEAEFTAREAELRQAYPSLKRAMGELEQAEAEVKAVRARAFAVRQQLAATPEDAGLRDELSRLLRERQVAQERVARLLPLRMELRERRMQEMRQRAEAFQVAQRRSSPDTQRSVDVPLEMRREPLVRYSEVLWAEDATLWVWGQRGRPRAALLVEAYPFPTEGEEPLWCYVMTSLSDDLIRVEQSGGWQWSSQKPGVVLRPVPGAAAPAEAEPERLSQMQQMAQRFAVANLGPGYGRQRARLEPVPAHRYADPESGLQDGAIFVLTLGRRPFALLLFESRPAGSPSPSWHYALARIGGGVMVGLLDDREVWRTTNGNPDYVGDEYWCLEETAMRAQIRQQKGEHATPESERRRQAIERRLRMERLQRQVDRLQRELDELKRTPMDEPGEGGRQSR
ncbi:MAG: hypothetical protein HY000_00960 [Planctomycetes bacterium]|nr:hypothetical protein [Planctomycetota bacterium]